ncbi:MAG: hypothetical protein WBE50_18205, partial [Methyloceanibacter sp.]
MLIEVSGLGGAYRVGSVETPAVGYNGSRWEAFIASLVRFVRQTICGNIHQPNDCADVAAACMCA